MSHLLHFTLFYSHVDVLENTFSSRPTPITLNKKICKNTNWVMRDERLPFDYQILSLFIISI